MSNMSSQHESGLSTLDQFTRELRLRSEGLLQTQQRFGGFMSASSWAALGLVLKMCEDIIVREVARSNTGDTYVPLKMTVNQPGARDQHTDDLIRQISSLDAEITDPSPQGQLRQSDLTLRAEPPQISTNASPMFPGRLTNNGGAVSSRPKGHESRSTGSSKSSGPFACTECPMQFQFLSKFKDHERKHLPPSYKCRTCGELFTQDRTLKKHIKRKHSSVENATNPRAQEGRNVPQECESVSSSSSSTQNQQLQEPPSMPFQQPRDEIPIDPQLHGVYSGTVNPRDIEICPHPDYIANWRLDSGL